MSDPRAILENELRHYLCLKKGETINIMFNGKDYKIDVVEVWPKNDLNAININETDINIDFLPPLDYEDIPKRPNLIKNDSKLNTES